MVGNGEVRVWMEAVKEARRALISFRDYLAGVEEYLNYLLLQEGDVETIKEQIEAVAESAMRLRDELLDIIDAAERALEGAVV